MKQLRFFGPNVECLPLEKILLSLQNERLAEELGEMSNEASLIAFLCKDTDDFSNMSKFKQFRQDFLNMMAHNPWEPVYSTIEAFWGLETRTAHVLLGLHKCKTDEELMRLLYLGVSEVPYVFIEADDQLISEFTQDMTKRVRLENMFESISRNY